MSRFRLGLTAMQKYLDLHAGRITLREFEIWLYNATELEEILPRDDYIDLLALDYSNRKSRYEIFAILDRYMDWPLLDTLELTGLLESVARRDDDVASRLVRIYDLYCAGYYFLQKLALDYALGITYPGSRYHAKQWEDLTEAQQKEMLDGFYPSVREEAQQVLGRLNSGAIVLTGRSKAGSLDTPRTYVERHG